MLVSGHAPDEDNVVFRAPTFITVKHGAAEVGPVSAAAAVQICTSILVQLHVASWSTVLLYSFYKVGLFSTASHITHSAP